MDIAINDAQLMMMIATDTGQAFDIAIEDFKTGLESEISGAGVPVQGGGIGDIEAVWQPRVTFGLSPEISLQYTQGGLEFDAGSYRHVSPIGTPLGNFADLIIQGRGGLMPMFGGEANPTRNPRDFWSPYESLVAGNYEQWIRSAMLSVGMPLM